ncbi:MAG: hypothetical protein Q9216_006354 [Gyalolechia sp. 2 TL-2023]
MGDPLSVASSIAGLVTLADIVFGRIYKYVQAVKGANKEIVALSSEVGALYGILSNLQLVSRQLEDRSLSSTPRIHHLGSCHRTLERLKEILDRDDTSSVQTQSIEKLKRRLHWPLSSSEMKTILADIERHKATLGLALNVDGVSGLLQSLSLQSETCATVQGIKVQLKEKYEADTRIAMDTKRQKTLKSFGETDPRRNQKMSLRLRQPGTGFWFLESQEFQDWLQTENAKLWLYGIPGAGKTVLASTVIEEILRISNTNHAVAFFYCDYKDPATQNPLFILGSLIQQIAKQDEQSFEKVQAFCDRKNPECKADYDYDCQALRDLILDIVSCFDCATVVVDGVDECGTHTAEVIELLTSLNAQIDSTNIKTLFLSRDEIDIRECLGDYSQVAIAANKSDLRLYVGAEIDIRIRSHKLRIRDPSLKGYIMDTLVDGAEGMFRWVTCQMDHLCELPNDTSRRKALGNLPRGLNATYERILRRVNASNREVRLLVSRALRWIIHSEGYLSTTELCEAISINFGDTWRDADSVPDEVEILRWCSSLVRKSENGCYLELAHFTVEEFLRQIEDKDEGEFALFRLDSRQSKLELAKVCLTYLNFRDFDDVGYINWEVMQLRFMQFPLRLHSAKHWIFYTDEYHHDGELLPMIKQLMNPSKPGTFISWIQDMVCYDRDIDDSNWTPEKIDTLIAEMSTLHIAAWLNLPEICTWLIEGGCDVNRNSVAGCPLYCNLVPRALPLGFFSSNGRLSHGRVTSILLEAGADPNYYYMSGRPNSLLFASLEIGYSQSAIELLKKGAKLDESSLAWLENEVESSNSVLSMRPSLRSIIEHIEIENVQDEHRARALKLCLEVCKSGAPNLLEGANPFSENAQMTKFEYERTLRTAAQFGRVQFVAQLLRVPDIDSQAAEESTGRTALHYAAMHDHLEIVKLLQTHGAQCKKTDSRGRTAIHHAASISLGCLKYFLEQGIKDLPPDDEGVTLWHQAAKCKNTKLLDVLGTHLPIPSFNKLKTNGGWSPLLYAASNGSTECVEWLLQAGCMVTDSANDGLTALHLASKYGSLRTVQLLLDRGSDINAVTEDGSTVLHHALLGLDDEIDAVVDLLLGRGVNLYKAREDGIMPMHLIIAHSIDACLTREKERLTLKNLFPLFPNIKSTAVSDIVFSGLSFDFDALVSIFKKFMAYEMERGSHVAQSKLTLRLLADSWQKPRFGWSFEKLTRLMHEAMMVVPLAGSLHIICTDPGLTISALHIGDEELVYNLLEHSPDVDYISGRSSIVTTACTTGCSSTLLEQLLARSSTVRNNNKNTSLLRLACEAKAYRSLGMVDVLLNKGFSPNDRCPTSGQTPLMIAARRGNVDTVNLLVSHGADTSVLDKNGFSAIHHACMMGCKKILQTLKATQIDWNHGGTWNAFSPPSPPVNGASPLHIAASLDDNGILDYLLDEELICDINTITDSSETALYIATIYSRPMNVASLLSRGADTTIRDTLDGWCPIHVAAQNGDKAIISLFLNHKSNSEILDSQGLNCEMIARKYGHKDVAEIFREYSEKQGGNSETTSRTTTKSPQVSEALKVAIDIADTDWCQRIINDGENLDLGFEVCHGCTPLLYALGDGPLDGARLAIVELLAREGSSTKHTSCDLKTNTRGFTTLHYAAEFGPSDVKSKIDFPTDFDSSTPLHIAAYCGHVRIVGYLLERGASVDVVDEKRWNALHYATQATTHAAETSRLLLDYGANLHSPTELLDTPLIFAACIGKLDLLQALVTAGADIRVRNLWGRTPFHLAAEYGSIPTVEFLFKDADDRDLGHEDCDGNTPLSTLLASGALEKIVFAINLAPGPRAYEPQIGNILANAVWNENLTPSLLRKLLKRLSPPVVATLLSHKSILRGTPLYAACTMASLNRQEDFINILLQAGTDLEQEGGGHGTPLMGACATGRLPAVKLLISKGAQISYQRDGTTISALDAAKHFPKITRWLLVERYTMGPKRICQA